MKKLAITVLAAALIAALALPPVFGRFTEQQVEARAAQLGESGGLLDAEVRSFDRGWFGSTAKVDVAIRPAARARLDDLRARSPDPRAASAIAALANLLERPFTVDVRMSHGPLMLRDGVGAGFSRMTARLDPDTEGVEALLAALDIPYLFEFRGRTGFDGVFRFNADVPPLDYAADGDRLVASGVDVEGTVRGNLLDARGRADSVTLAAVPWRLEIEAFTAVAEEALLSEGLVFGSFETDMERLALFNEALSDAPLFEALAPSFAGDIASNGTGDLVNIEFSQRVASLSAGETARLEDATFSLRARNIDILALRRYAGAVQRGGTPPGEALSAPLLAASPAFALDPVRFHLNGEPFEATLEAEVQGGALPAASDLDVTDRALWARILQASAAVHVSKALAEDLGIELAKMQLRGSGERSEEELEARVAPQVGLILLVMSAQGFIDESGDNYATEVSYVDGTLRVNGRELPLGLALR